MKKFATWIIIGFLAIVLTACGGEDEKLVVGATNEPHAMILEKAKPILKEKGIELDIQVFSKYELINKALDNGDLDANYFQHIPYYNKEIEEFGYDFENAGGIHIEPMGIYSQQYESLDELPDGATVIMSNSTSDHGRILSLLKNAGLITLKDGVDPLTATVDDIAENLKNLQFDYDYAPDLLPTIYKNNEGDVVAINSNYALDAGLNPVKDSIAIEDENSPYVNIIAVRSGDEQREDIQTLIEVLHSKEIQQYILDEWNGAVVPVN
ncbi:MetQ/NlpA family ABC transporter substrate-binding protein [Fervidibacillus halotolerans]|uniref:Lipoprotein n=1 Tax=Fervidibacillus halotolerans TaxID=2980027 RepID=A0A9E8LY53_9BACI|nr:MetQ/NlpA family ABC transporter substrate-binding protein [Fervidibacillus halotolerans]WAA11908.1 MetQ/NlpA family ABC transporter substrate-binding protein [Fervidibacillus halotolerans]